MKHDLRRDHLARRGALSMEERRRQSRAIQERLEALPVVRAARTIVGYHPISSEVDVLEFLRASAAAGRRLALPRIDGDELSLHAWHPADAMERSRLNVLEPMPTSPAVAPGSVDVILVPGVAFDRRGHRLGYGRAFYDRLLARIPRDRRVGLAFDEQLVETLPSEPHDEPVRWVVTPRATIHAQET